MKHIAILVLSLVLSSCATIVASGPDKVMVNSEPAGANVYLDDNLVGKTPMMLSIGRKSDGMIRIEAAGFSPVTIDRDKSVNGWIFVNLLTGPTLIFGTIIDFATSNHGRYSEDPIYIQLSPSAPNSSRLPATNAALP